MDKNYILSAIAEEIDEGALLRKVDREAGTSVALFDTVSIDNVLWLKERASGRIFILTCTEVEEVF